MSTPIGLEHMLRELIRDVVRDEIRAAFADSLHRNGASFVDSEDDGYMSLARAAEVADVAPGTIRRWIRERRLDASRAGRVYRVRRTELERFLSTPARDVIAEARAFLDEA